MKFPRLAVTVGIASVVFAAAASTPVQAHVAPMKVRVAAPQGPALVRLEAPSATVTTQSAGNYTLTLRKPEQIRWLGEVDRANGTEALTYGEQSPSAITPNWRKLLLDRQPSATATLTWNTSSAQPGYALVEFERPSYSKKTGITAKFTSADPIPAQLRDVSVNLHRVDEKQLRGFPTVSNFNVTSTITFTTKQTNSTTAQITISCATLSLYTLTLEMQQTDARVPWTMTCPNGQSIVSGSTFYMTLPTTNASGNVVFDGKIAASNQPPAQFNVVIAQLSYF